MKIFKDLLISAIDRYKDQAWYFYIPVTILISIFAINKIINPDFWGTPLSDFILGTHEAGHLLFSYFGRFITILGGSLLEIILPVSCVIYFCLKRRYYDAGFCLVWLAYCLFEIGTYMADAQKLVLPLLTDGFSAKTASHDWLNLFSMMGILDMSLAIANFVRICGYFVLFNSLGIVLWLQSVMILGAWQNRLKLKTP